MNRKTHNHIVFTKTISGVFLALCLFLGSSTAKAAWQDDANNRIEQFRKRNAQITVVDMNGQPVQDINVQITQVNHSFAFGAALSYSNVSGNATYRNFVLSHFNWAACENETKWGSNEGTRDVETYTQADTIYNWCNSNGIEMRGHCIFWEQNNGNMPNWVPLLASATYPTPSDLLSEVDERLTSVVTRYKDKFHNWDVDNEMLTDSTLSSKLGSGGTVHMFNASKAIDPNCGMFMNEYSGNSFGGYDSAPYVTRANSLISQGAIIDGYGIQAHVNQPFNPELYWSNVLKRLGVQGKPIWATEFDTDATDNTLRATDLYNFYLICFSDPNVQGIIQWGFMVGTTWRASGAWGIVSNTGVLNAAGVAYEALLDRWTTHDANYTDLNGKVNFRGFHGSYEITLSAPGQTTEVHAIELPPGTTPLQFQLATDLHNPEPDFNAPTPNPMTWATIPTAIGASTITMTAAPASDATPPVRYYFECTNHGEANSTWQTSSTYIAQSLNPSTLYSFRVKARDSASVPNQTGWSSTLSATTLLPGTTVELAGSWLAGTTHAKENGAERALIFIAHEESTSGNPALTSVTYGGQAMTKVLDVNAVSSGYGNYVAAFILNEAGIDAATSSTFVPTWSAATSSDSYASVFLSNVNQTTLIGASAKNSSTAATPNPITTAALSTNDGDMVILGATCGNLGSYTLNNSFTEGIDQAVGSAGHTGVTGHKSATGAAETPSATYATGPNRQAIIGFVVKAYEVPPAYSNCSEVIAAGYRLPADISGTGDCYVNYEDLATFVQYWLNTDCVSSGNCHGADFAPIDGTVDFLDFADFGPQWMTCNNPTDADCNPNWP
jgi:GH35 family endo-1,4-beta-xylanase